MSGLGDLNYLPQSNGDGNEPTYRMSMLPFGTYRNSDGTESLGLALPAMIHQPLMAVERLFGSGNFAKGPDYPGNADDMRTLLFSMYGGNALNPRSLLEEAAASAGPAAGRVASNGLRPGLTVTRTAPPGVPSAWHDIALDGDRIGRAYVREYPNTIQNSNFTIEPEFQRQGIGTEVQAELARMYGKPTVPDSTLSEAGYQRWLKNDPAAVADYRPMSEGANSYSPAPLTDAYFASMGGPPVPGSRAAAGELFSDTGKPSLMGGAVAGAEGNTSLRGYRGGIKPEYVFPPAEHDAFWGSSAPEVANTYAGLRPSGDIDNIIASRIEKAGGRQSVAPADFNFSNPMIVDAVGSRWDRIPFEDNNFKYSTTSDNLARIARERGHDGLILNNILDSAFAFGDHTPGNTYVALKRGTVTSPLTGETLFSDTGKPSLFGSASYQNQDPQNSYASGGNVADTSGLSGLTRLPDYGFGPMTPTTMAGYPNGFISSREPDPSWGDLALSAAEFPARATVNQFDAAGTGIADALNDPSLPNITNAGVQTGLALMSPELTVGSGLGGLGLAALRDADIVPSAEARRLRRPPPAQAAAVPLAPAPIDPVLEKIKDDPSLLALYQQIKVEQNNATRDYPGRNGDASRAEAAARVQGLQDQFSKALAARDAAKQGIYDQQVANALAAKDVELGRDRRFSDTEVGKVYDKLGGYAPLVAGFVPGVVSRLAYGPAENIGSKVLRGLTGATFGVGANNVPLVYNAFSTEVDNPEQRAYQEYAYNLPDGHPDKAKAQAMADSLPKLNQLRVQAGEELYDPEKFKERALMGALEGFGGNELGQMAPGAVGGFGRISSVQLPEKALLTNRERIGLGGLSPEVRAQQEAAAKLLADKQAAASLSSGPVGPVSEQSLPVLGGASDIPPAAPPKKAQGGGRRSKSAGTKGSSKPAPLLSNAPLASPPAAPETQSAASDELKRFFGAKQAPTLDDLKGFATGGRVSIDEAAKSVSATPTLGQKEAGNYKKAHVRLHGMDIAIENPRGSERFGVDKNGKRWSVNMPDHYGYIKRTEGKDGDHVDCYIGPNESSTKVFIVDQKDAHSGRFDEHKVMLGYPNRDTALSAYKRAFSDGKGADRIGDVTAMNVHQFKNWLRNGDTMKPVARQSFASGGAVYSDKVFAGPLHSDVAGRTDHLPIDVTAGSYVIPADVVSALGEGNTNGGVKVLQHMFPDQPKSLHYASGGVVPIMAAGGEHVLSPEQVAAVGDGDLSHGHAILDAFVKNTRNDTIKTLKSLPGPQK